MLNLATAIFIMKIAIFSDVHGNLPALCVVLEHIDKWSPDLVIVNGDVVNRGPRPSSCLDLLIPRLKKSNWRMTMGNHEDYVTQWEKQPQRELNVIQSEMYRGSYWTHGQLRQEQIAFIGKLPQMTSVRTNDGSQLVAAHATLRNNTDGIMPWTTEESLRKKITIRPQVFATAHTHRAFSLELDNTIIVNSGSVGVPLDGDPRAAYAQLTYTKGNWSCEFIRLEYDRHQTQCDFEESGFVNACGAPAALMHREWQDASSHLPHWYHQYQDMVEDGQLTVSEAVEKYLNAL